MQHSMSEKTPPVIHRPEVVLVTGGAGFIGSNFLLYMVPRHPEVQFVNLDSLTYAGNLLNLRDIEDAPNYRFVRGDVADAPLVERLFREHGITTVVHFAAESHVDRSIMTPLSFVLTNTVGTVTLLEAARKAWGDHADPERFRFYHISTDEVFGSLGPEGYFTESTPYNPRSPYAASKAASDHFVRAYWHTYGLPVVISNCSNNYGPYQFPEKLIPLVILNALENRPIPIYGKGENVPPHPHLRQGRERPRLALRAGPLHGHRAHSAFWTDWTDLPGQCGLRAQEPGAGAATAGSDRRGTGAARGPVAAAHHVREGPAGP